MASRRMFALSIVDSDLFLDMPLSTQALYFQLGMRADDDGFINNPKRIVRTVNATNDDLNLLIEKGYVLCLNNGIIVITHWKMHNYIQTDRYRKTVYEKELKQLQLTNKIYCKKNDTECIQEVSITDTQDRLGKNRLGKDNNIHSRTELDSATFDKVKIVVNYLNQVTGSSYKTSTNKTKSLINARLKEGFTVDDFKKVIDIKSYQWLNNKDMCKFLRPETLFGTKFEGYLNEKITSNDNLNFKKENFCQYTGGTTL